MFRHGMPCAGCKERMSEPQGTYEMRYIGKPDGVLMKGSPGNYEHGKVYEMPFRFSRKKFWVLLEDVPELVAPELVEEDGVFIPDDSAVIELMPSAPLVDDINIDPNSPATLEGHMTYNPNTGKMRPYEPEQREKVESEEVVEEDPIEVVEEISVKVEPTKKAIRNALIKTLEDAEVKIKKGTRTTTLQKMVDKLVSEE